MYGTLSPTHRAAYERQMAFAAFTGRIAAFWRRQWDEWADSRAARELSRLDDHMLRDIGIARSQIDYAARHLRGR